MKNKKLLAAFLAAFFSILFSILFKWGQAGNPFTPETILYGSVIFVNMLITGSIAYGIFRKYSHKSTYEVRKNLVGSFILFVLMAFVISLSIVSLGVYIFFIIKGFDTSNFWTQLFTVELPGAARQFAFWVLLGSVLFFYTIWRKAIDREQALREENLKFRYQTLKSQVNPHFLFNSLNTLSEIVYEDARRADQYIRKLSFIYRYVIENEETSLVLLEKEIDFVKEFFDLQKERDNGKINLSLHLENMENVQIVPVSLQMLIENALKHNAASMENPLKIKIVLEKEMVIVSNNIQRKNKLENSTGTGLHNLRERVKMIMNREMIFSEDNGEFLVKIPILRILP